ncbi:MAG TPA: YetF domain-containing protein [Pyrinomonadaceae bacterium]
MKAIGFKEGQMEEIRQIINGALGLGLETKDINVWQMSLRAIVVFILAIAMLRIGDKRFMGRSTAFDVMLGIIFGSVVSRAITGNAPFLPTLVASLVLVLLHWLLAAIAFRSRGFGTLVKGQDQLLVRDGQPQEDALRQTHLTKHDLQEALRNNGKTPDLNQIAAAHLERNGDISIIGKKD